jgi:phosphopantetheinyl transferase (holo-ACP synthase)
MTRSCPVLGIGVDVTGLWRWRSLLLREPDVVDVAFSEQERAWMLGRPERAALQWAAKEAAVKALGCGFGPADWQDVVVDLATSPPVVRISPRLRADLGLRRCRMVVSAGLSHRTPPLAIALAVAIAMPPHGSEATLAEPGQPLPLAVALERAPASGPRVAVRCSERGAAVRAVQLGLVTLGETRPYVLTRSPDGRPLLRSDAAGEPPLVSIAHCSGWAAAAVCRGEGGMAGVGMAGENPLGTGREAA